MKLTYIISTIVIAGTLFSSCSSADLKDESAEVIAYDGLHIEGKMSGGNGNTIYLFSLQDSIPSKLDSIEITDNDTFFFNRDQNGYEILGVGFTPVKSVPLIVNTKEQITITGTNETWTTDTKVSGSENSEAIVAYNKNRFKFFADMDLLRTKYNETDKNNVTGIDEINKQALSLQADFNNFKSDFIKTNINKPSIAAAIPDMTNIQQDIAGFAKMEATITKFYPNSFFSKSISKVLADNQAYSKQMQQKQHQQQKPKGLAIGTVAPELNFASPDGKKIKLSSLKGKVVLLDFWASWCGPCRKENPNVVDVYNRYKDKGFTVYSVSLDNKKPNWLAAIKKDGLVWPNHVSDLKGWQSDAAALYGINSIPMTYLLDADGIIVESNLRGAQLETKLKEILK